MNTQSEKNMNPLEWLLNFLKLPFTVKTIDEKVCAISSFAGLVVSAHIFSFDSFIGFVIKAIGACIIAILSAYFGKLGLDIYKQFPCSKIYIVVVKYIPSLKQKNKQNGKNNNRN